MGNISLVGICRPCGSMGILEIDCRVQYNSSIVNQLSVLKLWPTYHPVRRNPQVPLSDPNEKWSSVEEVLGKKVMKAIWTALPQGRF